MKTPKISSDFAILDVKVGRAKLDKIVGDHRRRVPVTITGFITNTHSHDDGTSIEFSVDVTALKLGEPVAHDCTCIRCRGCTAAEVAIGNHDRI